MADNVTHLDQFRSGLLGNNPVLVQLLGMCPVLAVTSSVENGLVMGGAATFVVVMSNLITSLLRKVIQPHVRILIFTLTIATFVTIADLTLKAYVFDVAMKLGAFIPLIIVNCMIIARAELVAMRNGVARSLADAFGIGLGFTAALVILGSIREVFGSASLMGIPLVPGAWQQAIEPHKWIIMILPPGAFLTLGVLVGVVNHLRQSRSGGA